MMSRKIRLLLVCALIVPAGSAQVGLAEPNAVEIDVFENTLWEQELVTPMGWEMVRMTGTSTVHVFFEGPAEGSADDDDANGLEEVPTELVELSLTGSSPSLGPVHMRLWVALPSVGQMEETADNTAGLLDVPPFAPGGTVESFFDAYLEVEMLDQMFYIIQPMRLSSILGAKPAGPGEVYESAGTLQLIDQDGNPTDLYLGPASYAPNPLVEVDAFVGSTCEVNVVTPGARTYSVALEGSSAMHAFFEGPTEGSAEDDTGNGKEEVITELVELNLRGFSEGLGSVHLVLNTNLPSLGQMEEDDNNTVGVLDVPPFAASGTVESFFDVYFQIEIGGQQMYASWPQRWSGQLREKPAGWGDWYDSLQEVPLLGAKGEPTDYSVSYIRYTPRPCGDAAHPYPVGDFNLDCLVDFRDFAVFSLHWLECTRAECP
jgi:hypothetical protein